MKLEKHGEFCRLFTLAERKIKQVENTIDDVVIPAINELRYAGFHCACSLDTENEQQEADELKTGEKHCKRAIYDVLEAGILFYIREITDFIGDYKYAGIGGLVSGFSDNLCYLRDVQNYVAAHSREEAEQEWEIIQEHFEQIRRFYNTLDAAREPLQAELFKWRLGVIVSILSLIVAAVALLLVQL